MANVAAIRDRIKSNIESGTNGLFVFDTMPAQPPAQLPCAIVTPATGEFINEVTIDGCEDVNLVVVVLVQKVSDAAAQDNADAWLSETTNIGDAIDAGSSTDWDYCQTMTARNYGGFTFGSGEGAVQYLGFEIPVMVGVS